MVSRASMRRRSSAIAAARVGSSRSLVRPRTSPICDTNDHASSADAPSHIGAVIEVTRPSTNPDWRRSAITDSASASPKGPGSPACGVGRFRPTASASKSVVSHSLCSNRCHDRNAMRPPGRRLRRTLANASSGSEKNIAPNTLIATSNEAGSNGYTWASAWRNSTLVKPSSAVRRRASSSIREERSTPRTEPARALRAASRLDLPVPQPTSSTLSNASMSVSSSNRSAIQRSVAS